MPESSRTYQVGKRVRLLRKQHGWTQIELAEKSNLHRSHIILIEKGELNFSIGTICKIIDSFDITVAEFFEEIV